MAPYATLRRAAGLSREEAALWHSVHRETVRSWEREGSGGRDAPDGVLDELRALIALQNTLVQRGEQPPAGWPEGARAAVIGRQGGMG